MKATYFATGRSVLVEEGQFFVLKLLEEIVPFNRIERLVRRFEVKPQNAGIVAGLRAPYRGWYAAPVFHPLSDRLVIRGDFAF